MIKIEANVLGYTEEEYIKFKKVAWCTLIAFALLCALTYCGKLNLGLSMTKIIEETGWSKGQLGILSAILFWTCGIGHLINGRLSEILGAKKFITVGAILTILANVLVSFQTSFVAIAVIWGFNGYFQSMFWSPGLLLISKWWPANSRGFANGTATASTATGSLFAWILVYLSFLLLPEIGWRAAFIFPMIFMGIVAIVFAILAKEKPSVVGIKKYKEPNEDVERKERVMVEVVKRKGKLYPYIYLLRQWMFIVWMIIIACSSLIRYGLMTWIPSYYVEAFNTDIEAGLVGTIGLPIGMACGAFIVPWLTDKFCPTNRMPAVIICALLAGTTVLGFSQSEHSVWAGVWLFAAGFFIYSINGIAWTYATDVGGRIFSGTAVGVLDCAAYMGASIQAIVFGSILNGGNWNSIFIFICGACVVIAILALIASVTKDSNITKNR